jgi:short-subunit dehydrogenase
MNIIITGGSKGIGKAIALKFAENGYQIIICSRSIEHLESAKADIEQHCPNAVVSIFVADLSVRQMASDFADFALSKGPVDVLVNNSGTYIPGVVSTDDEQGLELMMNQNFYSTFYLTRMLIVN